MHCLCMQTVELNYSILTLTVSIKLNFVEKKSTFLSGIPNMVQKADSFIYAALLCMLYI